MSTQTKHVVIIGAGFGGITAAQHLVKNKQFEITLIDQHNYHLFQPFLYQVASASLAPSDIATPIRHLFHGYYNMHTVMDKVHKILEIEKKVITEGGRQISFDYLIVATGSESNFYGHEQWKQHCISLKKIEDAERIKKLLLTAYERIVNYYYEEQTKPEFSCIIIGGGPTGVELAGSIAEFLQPNQYPHLIKVTLIEGASRLLPSFSESSSKFAYQSLRNLGITVQLNTQVNDIKQEKVVLINEVSMQADLIIWTAGVQAIDMNNVFESKLFLGQGKRVIVNQDLTLPGYPEIYVIGDVSESYDEEAHPLPGLAAVAKQQGKFVAKSIVASGRGKLKQPKFHYFHQGNLAIISRYSAVAEFKYLKLKGITAWLLWGLVHIYFLIGFRNRVTVFIKWIWGYISRNKAEHIIL